MHYFNGHLPVFVHEKSALRTSLFSTQLVINGNATQAEISRAFGVPLVTVKRYVNLYPAQGATAFFCTCQEALGQQIDCGSLPTGSRRIGPGTDCVPEVRSGGGDFVQYLAQGNPCGPSAAWKKKYLPTMRKKSERSIAALGPLSSNGRVA